jgi:hypothetical protein
MPADPQSPTPVVVVSFNMPFGQLVLFMVKVALAAIPALIILTIIAIGIGVVVIGAGRGITDYRQTSRAGAYVRSLEAEAPANARNLAERRAQTSAAAPVPPDAETIARNEKAERARRTIAAARTAAFARCSTLPPGDAAVQCATRAGDCVRAHASVAPLSSDAGALIACFNAVQP